MFFNFFIFFTFSISLQYAKPLFQKIIPWWHLFLLCSCFREHPTNTTSQNIGGTDAWAVPHPNFWGDLPQTPYVSAHAVSSCLNRYLLASLVRCALLIAVIFLYLSPVLLYPRAGHLKLWVLHSGMTLLLHYGVWSTENIICVSV